MVTQQEKGPDSGHAPKASDRFACDVMLGKLSRELRILGIDVEYHRAPGGMQAYRAARSQQRTFLTRSRRLRDLPGVFLLRSERTPEQLQEVKEHFRLGTDPGQALNRCLVCNVPLEKITREQARPAVPFFTFQIHHQFRRCPKCKRVYWPGSHAQDMAARALPEKRPSRRGQPRGRRRGK